MVEIVKKIVRNKDVGRFGFKPEAIVIHIAEGYLNGAHSWFNNPSSQASAHYMVGRNGAVWQFVEDTDTAWHAGSAQNPTWKKLKNGVNPNFYTIGIEHEGFTGEIWPSSMLENSAQLIAQLCRKWSIPSTRENIIGHNEINSVSRNRCPGSGVDLQALVDKVNNILNEEKMIEELKLEIKNLNLDLVKLQKAIIDRDAFIEELKRNPDKAIRDENNRLRVEIVNLQNQIQALNKKLSDSNSKNNPISRLFSSLFGK